jgi:hypothetical protein
MYKTPATTQPNEEFIATAIATTTIVTTHTIPIASQNFARLMRPSNANSKCCQSMFSTVSLS